MNWDKVLLVVEAAGAGGTEAYVEGLADHLAPVRGIEIVVLSGATRAAADRFPGHRTCVVDGAAGLAAHLRDGAVLANLHLYSSLLPATRAARQARVPVVATLHMPLAPWNLLHRARWRGAVGLSHGCIGVSGDCLAGYGPFLRGKPRCVVPGPLPLDLLPAPRTTLRTERTRPAGPFRIACTARLSREKDIPTLLKAMARCEGMHLTLIGDGALRGALEAQAAALGVPVTFTGLLPRAEVFARLLEADAFVLPSRFEGLGLAALEAMALGTPTVTADFPASVEYIRPGRTGLVFPRGNAQALAAALERLRADDTLRAALSREGAAFVREIFTPAAQYGRYAAFLDEVGGQPPRALALAG